MEASFLWIIAVRAVSVRATFRVAGRAPQFWYAETGKRTLVSYSSADGRTTVPLSLEPWGTVFVIFRQPTSKISVAVASETETTFAAIDGPWKLAFLPGRSAPVSIQLDHLIDWSKSDDAGVKYLLGIGTYTTTFDIPSAWLRKGTHLWIDLGDVRNLAAVKVNRENLGETWHSLYSVDATSAFRPGANEIEIKVVNARVNRLIGDQQPGVVKYTFTDVHPYDANSLLQSSGLIGPVTLVGECAAHMQAGTVRSCISADQALAEPQKHTAREGHGKIR